MQNGRLGLSGLQEGAARIDEQGAGSDSRPRQRDRGQSEEDAEGSSRGRGARPVRSPEDDGRGKNENGARLKGAAWLTQSSFSARRLCSTGWRIDRGSPEAPKKRERAKCAGRSLSAPVSSATSGHSSTPGGRASGASPSPPPFRPQQFSSSRVRQFIRVRSRPS